MRQSSGQRAFQCERKILSRRAGGRGVKTELQTEFWGEQRGGNKRENKRWDLHIGSLVGGGVAGFWRGEKKTISGPGCQEPTGKKEVSQANCGGARGHKNLCRRVKKNGMSSRTTDGCASITAQAKGGGGE